MSEVDTSNGEYTRVCYTWDINAGLDANFCYGEHYWTRIRLRGPRRHWCSRCGKVKPKDA